MSSGGAYRPGLPVLQPDVLLAAGVNPRQLARTNVADIPVTQEDREQLGVTRNRKLGHMKWLGIILAVVSILSLVLMAMTVSASPADQRGMIYVGVLPGIVGICIAILSLGMVKAGKDSPAPDETTYCFRCMTICQIITGWMGSMMCLSAFGLAGVWLLVDCSNYTPPITEADRRWNFNRCHTNTGTLLALSVFNVIIFIILIVLVLANICVGGCCHSRAFGIKSRYEELLDLQTARMMEMQRVQAAQNPGMVQAGYQPQQMGPGYQPQYPTGYQPSPQTQYQTGYQPDPQYQTQTGPHTFPPQGQMGSAEHVGYRPHMAPAKQEHGHHHYDDRTHDRYHHGDHEHGRYNHDDHDDGHHEAAPSAPLMDDVGNRSATNGEAPPPSYSEVIRQQANQ